MLGSKVEFHHDVWVQHSVKFIKNKLRTIQPQNLGKIKNSQSEPQCYWFLHKRVYTIPSAFRLKIALII